MAEGHVRDKLTYPLPAVVGNDLAKKAIVVSLSSPDIHSLLICGPKGTGKSVLARSSESVSGGRRVLNLPSGSTEDRVFGGMDFERTVRDGRRACTGNLLSEADGNILLADNVNLLPEHIVHQVLNAAENGGFTIEREGISTSFDTSFLFIATMDPEEGMMSEHLLDRFDLCVFTATSDDEDERAEIADRNMRFLRDPEGFIEGCSGETGSITENIQRAYARARFTRIPDGYCGAISEVCNQLNVSGHRGDIAVMNASCAIAALDDRDIATLDDLKQAAAMCLEHRRNDDRQQQAPQEEPPEEDDEPDDDGEDQQQDQDEPEEDPNSDGTPDDHDNTREDDNDGPSDPDMPDLPPPGSEDMSEQVFEIGESFRVRDYMPGGGETLDKGMGGRRRGSKVQDRNGRCIGYAIPKGKVTDIALCASIRAAAPYQVLRDHSELAIVLSKDDLREKVREKRRGNSILFLVDGSGSIGAQRRMVAVKGAILSMLRDAYEKRDEIGMAVFRVDSAEEVLPLTRSILRAYHVLGEIPTGGRTPLTHGLIKGHEILTSRVKDDTRKVMVILTDGGCNVSYTPGRRAIEEMLSTAEALSQTDIEFIVIDTETGRLRLGMALDLCRALRGTYLGLEDLNADSIERSVRMALGPGR